MTTRGRIFVGAGVLIGLAGMVLGLVDLMKVGSLLVVLPLLARLLARRDLDVEVGRRVAPSRVETDGHADVTLEVRNAGRRTTPLLRAEEWLSFALGDRPHLLVPRLEGGETRRLTYRVRSHVRGHHPIGPLAVRVTDPFGLASRTVEVPGRTTLVVLPRVVPLTSVRGVSAGGGGDVTSSPRVALHGEDDIAVREYRDGDDLRRIHWPSTARTGETMVRQDEQPSRRRALVVLDDRALSHAGTGGGGSFEWSVTAAASAVTMLLAEGFEVYLSLTSDESGALAGVEDHDHALDVLAAVQPSSTSSPRGLVEALDEFGQHGGGLVVGVIGALDPDVTQMCTANRHRAVALVIDRDGFTASGSGEGPADTTAVDLSTGGWRAVVVRPGAKLPQVWSELTVGLGVRV